MVTSYIVFNNGVILND